MPLQPQQKKDLEDNSDPDDFDPHFRPKDITKDLAKLKKVTATGKKACLGGIVVTLFGGVISLVGLMRDAGATKFKNWFGASLASWILILFAQGVCTWEVLDRAKRHNEKLVNRCKWLYVAAVALSAVLLLLLLSIWAVNGSFVDADSSETFSWVLLVLVLILLCFGIVPLLFVYFKYAKQIKNTDSHSARPKVPMTRTLSNAANEARRSIKRTVSNRSKSSKRSKRSRSVAYPPPDSISGDDKLPEFPVYDYEESVKAGEIISRPVSPVPSRAYPRRTVDGHFGVFSTREPDSDSSPNSRKNPRPDLPASLRITRPNPKQPRSIPYVPRPSSSDFSPSSDSDPGADQLFLPPASTGPYQSKKPNRSTIPDKDELFLDAPLQIRTIPRKPLPWLTDRSTLPSQRPLSSSSYTSRTYQAYSPPTASSPPPSPPLPRKSISPSPSQYQAYRPPSSASPTRNSTVSSVQSRYSTSASTVRGGGSRSRTSSVSSTSSWPDPSTIGAPLGRNTQTKQNPFSSDSDTDSSIDQNYLRRTNSLGSLSIANP